MKFLVMIGSGLALGVGVAGWIAGFVRVVRRQPINDRLKMYCERQ